MEQLLKVKTLLTHIHGGESPVCSTGVLSKAVRYCSWRSDATLTVEFGGGDDADKSETVRSKTNCNTMAVLKVTATVVIHLAV